MKKIFKNFFLKKFKSYWKDIQNKDEFDDTLKNITENFINSESYSYVSNQWHILNINDYESLRINGLKKYGSEISTHYFTFLDYHDDHLKNLFKEIDNNMILNSKIDIFKKQKNIDLKTSFNYNILCWLLYENLKKLDVFKYLDKLNDKTYCAHEHPFINIENNKISSDKIISLFDYNNINRFYQIDGPKKNLLEIGAGSGRLSECILSINNYLKYTICDIPPSIYISFERMKIAFPDRKIKLLIDINDQNSLLNHLNENDICFIFPHQLKMIKENYFDLTMAIDCLHEMDKKTIKFYFDIFNKITKNFYFSIWEKTKNWHSGSFLKKTEKLDFHSGDYPVPDNWENLFKENLKFPSNQIGVGYKIKD